ncbi:MAG: CDGSH iron-sulfur domain-containing protein [Vicingus serpentipes]|nr:CDGSH iron-sulfur domain-containing protein [Vicingus serpentipes]
MKVKINDKGPAVLSSESEIEIEFSNGRIEKTNTPVAICRCGKTGNGPFCDGSHKK